MNLKKNKITKKLKITFLIDKKNDWFTKHLIDFTRKKSKNTIFKIKDKIKNIRNQDVVFFINLTNILKERFLKKNKLNLVIHASNLPKDKGGAPLQWQILRGKNEMAVCLFEATKQVDAGDIVMKTKIKFNGSELYDELRDKQAKIMIKLIKNFLKIYPNFKRKKQLGKSTFNRLRKPKDSELNIHKSIKSQFNLIRIADNKEYPLFFYINKKKYFLRVYK